MTFELRCEIAWAPRSATSSRPPEAGGDELRKVCGRGSAIARKLNAEAHGVTRRDRGREASDAFGVPRACRPLERSDVCSHPLIRADVPEPPPGPRRPRRVPSSESAKCCLIAGPPLLGGLHTREAGPTLRRRRSGDSRAWRPSPASRRDPPAPRAFRRSSATAARARKRRAGSARAQRRAARRRFPTPPPARRGRRVPRSTILDQSGRCSI